MVSQGYYTRIGCFKGSVSLWVRDITLTPEQRAELEQRRSPRQRGQFKGAEAVAAKYREMRRKYQEEGRFKAREMDPLHLAGCMLYWAEGAKAKNVLRFSNSDPGMMQFYIRFLRESLQIDEGSIRLRLTCYLDNGLDVEEVEEFWLNVLNLTIDNMHPTIKDSKPMSSRQQGRKLLYGMCVLDVSSTEKVQHVFGAIQEYSGIDNPDWLQ